MRRGDCYALRVARSEEETWRCVRTRTWFRYLYAEHELRLSVRSVLVLESEVTDEVLMSVLMYFHLCHARDVELGVRG
jgi:hypothetical protein